MLILVCEELTHYYINVFIASNLSDEYNVFISSDVHYYLWTVQLRINLIDCNFKFLILNVWIKIYVCSVKKVNFELIFVFSLFLTFLIILWLFCLRFIGSSSDFVCNYFIVQIYCLWLFRCSSKSSDAWQIQLNAQRKIRSKRPLSKIWFIENL